ncbi:unnamed protein product [Camellia sinensis]
MEMEIDPPKKPEVGAEAIKNDDFFNSAENGDSSFFEALSHDQLLKALSLRNEDCRSLLHVAASSAHPKVVKILSAADPSVTGINSADEEGWAPLHSASSSGNVEIVEILLSSGADVNLKNNGGRTALHYAASKGWLKIAEILLSHGANINLKDKVGCTPLHRAASTGNSELCELLIEEGAEVDAIDKAGQTPLMSAVICENKECHCCLLLKGQGMPIYLSGPYLEMEKFSILRCMCFHFHWRCVALLLIRHGANVDVEDKEGYTVLGRASVDLRPILIDAAKAMLEE